jgi:hypothetical protein
MLVIKIFIFSIITISLYATDGADAIKDTKKALEDHNKKIENRDEKRFKEGISLEKAQLMEIRKSIHYSNNIKIVE